MIGIKRTAKIRSESKLKEAYPIKQIGKGGQPEAAAGTKQQDRSYKKNWACIQKRTHLQKSTENKKQQNGMDFYIYYEQPVL